MLTLRGLTFDAAAPRIIVPLFARSLGALRPLAAAADADPAAEDALVSDRFVSVTEQNGNRVFAPESPTAGLIFYPGGKVENTAYAPLLHDLAEDGILCVLVKMPCNLAVLDRNAADGIPERFSEVTDWYIGGHSLGGAMAAWMNLQ